MFIVTPNSGSTFGWLRPFHSKISSQSLCAIVVSSSLRTFGKLSVVTHSGELLLLEVACRVYFQSLDCDLATSVFAHPHVGVSIAVQCVFRLVIANCDFE